jgi:hypothetical protein
VNPQLASELFADKLQQIDACDEAIEWVGSRSAAEAWRDCPRGDWMLWLLARVGADRRRIVLAACECARMALPYVPEGEDRPRIAIETAEAWARGEATTEQVRAAAVPAADAAEAADAYYAYAVAAYAGYSAADAGYAGAAACGRYMPKARSADIVRKHFPVPPEFGEVRP